jgi:hypothetical protein
MQGFVEQCATTEKVIQKDKNSLFNKINYMEEDITKALSVIDIIMRQR